MNKVALAFWGMMVCLIVIGGMGPTETAAGPDAPQSLMEPSPVQVIALPEDAPIRIPPPPRFIQNRRPTATFSINYLAAGTPDGQGATCLAWNASAQAAFSYAASIWATQINSVVPIRINACWANLGSPSILGYSWSNMKRDFTSTPQPGTWYSYALADALAGSDLDGASPDTYITYNNGFSWYFGTDGNTPAGQYDLVSIVLHEMAHGLNFAGSMNYGLTRCGNATYGCWGYGTIYPNIYDRFTENGSGQALLNTGLYPNPSAALGTELKSNNLYFDGTNTNAANGGTRAKIYAPSTWASGSSYSHLDYTTYSAGANRLMVYAFNSGASIHTPGPVIMGILSDIGWPSASQNQLYLPLILKTDAPVLPSVPTLNAISNPSNSNAYNVTWTTASNASTYILQESFNDAGFASPTEVYNGASTSWPASGKPAGTYYYRVKAHNATGDSGWSGTQSTTVAPASGPTDGHWTGTTSRSRNMSFNVSSSGTQWNTFDLWTDLIPTSCGIYSTMYVETTAPGPGNITSNQFSFSGSFAFTGQFSSATTASGTYAYTNHPIVIGLPNPPYVCTYYLTQSGTWNASFAGSPPAAPTLNSISNADGDGNYDVSWNSVSGATAYVLQEASDGSFTSPTTAYSGTATLWLATGKASGSYYYRVKASNAAGESGWSGTQSTTVTSGSTGIHGRVTDTGVAASGVSLSLRFYNGLTWSTQATTTTDSNGNYSFTGAPSLGSGQRYYVLYQNSGTTTRLSSWATRILTSYTAGADVAIGDFDLANIPLVSPASGSTVSLPYMFQWTRRTATTSDSYEFNLLDPADGDPWWWTGGLGYVSSYTLNSRPSGFLTGVQYGWFAAVYSSDGGYGESYYYRTITFATGSAVPTQLPLAPMKPFKDDHPSRPFHE